MQKLKKIIIKLFLFFAFIIAVLESIIDSIFDDFVYYLLKDNTIGMSIAVLLYIVTSLGIFFVFAFCFYKVIDKKIMEEAHKQIKEKNLLYANITHDLKTPITSILGFSKALKDGKVEKDRMEEIFDTIYQKSKRTDELINQLFYYSRIENDEYQLKYEIHDICALVRNSVAGVYDKLEEKQMDIEINIPEEKILCLVDDSELSRAINNLLVNTYTHNLDHTRVRISITTKDGKVKIEIADDGKQIDPELRESIFEPFICDDESRQIMNGSGLGLAISKKILRRHNGDIYLDENVQGYKKAFVIELICPRND